MAAMAESTMASVRLAASTVLTSMSCAFCSWLDVDPLASKNPPPPEAPFESATVKDFEESSVICPVMTLALEAVHPVAAGVAANPLAPTMGSNGLVFA